MSSKSSFVFANKLETIQFDATISFDHFTSRVNNMVDMKPFSPPGLPETKLLFRLRPDCVWFTELQLVLLETEKRIQIKTECSIIYGDDQRLEECTLNKGYDKEEYWQNICRIERSKLVNRPEYLPGDTLTYKVEFTITFDEAMDPVIITEGVPESAQKSIKSEITESVHQMAKPEIIDKEGVLEDFESLLKMGKYTDVIFKVGDKEVAAHKAILDARSKTLGLLLEKNSKLNVIPIADIEADVFEQLLVFLYTGKILQLEKYAEKLLIAGDKYELPFLKATCEDFLCTKVTRDSVWDYICLGKEANANKLRDHGYKIFNKIMKEAMIAYEKSDFIKKLLK